MALFGGAPISPRGSAYRKLVIPLAEAEALAASVAAGAVVVDPPAAVAQPEPPVAAPGTSGGEPTATRAAGVDADTPLRESAASAVAAEGGAVSVYSSTATAAQLSASAARVLDFK